MTTYPAFETERARLAIRGTAALQDYATPPASAAAAGAGQIQHAAVSVTTATTTALIAGVAGAVIEVLEIMLYTDTSMDLELFDGSLSLTGLLKAWPANQGFFFPFTGEPHFKLTAGSSFQLTTGAAGQVSGFIRYRQV